MGNGNSRLKGLEIDKNAVEANDFWALFNAESPTTSNEDGRQLLSIFQGEAVVNGQLWVTQGPMERTIKNLRIYRHPYILKYIATWEQGGQKYLATERVRPLSLIMPTLSDIQICLGLRTILCSLIFLIEKANARHINICIPSIYVTDNGSWRLSGFEYVWKCKEVTKTLLDLASAYRYKNAIDPEENAPNNIESIEQYAFAIFCEEILSKCSKSVTATPYVQEFRDYCADHLKHKNPKLRPNLSAVLLHPYFNHEFVLIHSFLFELPLKSVQEKQDFFAALINRLQYFNEEVVGDQLAADLVSRMVLLDPTAQLCVTPYVLKTRSDHASALFSNQTYSKYLMPHIKKMFRLRDAQIRLILLEYFMEFVRLLPKDEIESVILPHLLAGMNDTNDVLVAKTLRCLADLVPILGAGIVLGGNRSRLFSDGRPQAAVPDSASYWVEPRSITPVLGNSVDYMVSGSPMPPDIIDIDSSEHSLDTEENLDDQLIMPPRLSPDGGEDEEQTVITDGLSNSSTSVERLNKNTNDLIKNHHGNVEYEKEMILQNDPISETKAVNYEDEEPWSDWETDELQRLNDQTNTISKKILENNNTTLPLNIPEEKSTLTLSNQSSRSLQNTCSDSSSTSQLSSSSSQQPKLKALLDDDFASLDIKLQKLKKPLTEQTEEFDFFKDMEPVIDTRCYTESPKDNDVLIDASRFAAVSLQENGGALNNNATEGDGWNVDDEDATSWST